MKTRTETDSFGPIEVPADHYWGAQTERSRNNFRIGDERMPRPLIAALALVKRAAAEVNRELGLLDARRAKAIVQAADEIIDGKLDDQFPARSLADRLRHADQHERQRGDRQPRHRAARRQARRQGSGASQRPRQYGPVVQRQFPHRDAYRGGAGDRASARSGADPSARGACRQNQRIPVIVKIGRTHLQDATPLTLGQEFSGYAAQVASGIARVKLGLKELYPLAQGGTAVGTGLNSKRAFAKLFAKKIARLSGLPFTSARNKFEALASHGALTFAHGALKALAADLFKIGNDIRFLGSGPRSGFGELILPENEPGSSIMPGKVNPTQCEALTMVCTRVFGNDVTVAVAASQGHFELNVFKPVIIDEVLQSIRLLADVAVSFTDHCVTGIRANEPRIRELLDNSLMLVTALAPTIGYDKAAQIAKAAHKNGTTLREEAIRLGFVSAKDFDRLVQPARMTHPEA